MPPRYTSLFNGGFSLIATYFRGHFAQNKSYVVKFIPLIFRHPCYCQNIALSKRKRYNKGALYLGCSMQFLVAHHIKLKLSHAKVAQTAVFFIRNTHWQLYTMGIRFLYPHKQSLGYPNHSVHPSVCPCSL